MSEPSTGALDAPTALRRLLDLAAHQHGVFSIDQLTRTGITDHALTSGLAADRFERLHRGVFAVRGAPATPARQFMVAVLLAGPHSAISHRTAATLHGLDVRASTPIEVTTLRGQRRRTRGTTGHIQHESTDLRGGDVMYLDDLPVTSPVRTLIDLGASATLFEVETALDDALKRKVVEIDDVRQRYLEIRRQGRRGCGPIGELLRRRDPTLEMSNTFEKLLLRAVRRAGLAEPEAQHRVDGEGFRYFVDFAWPEQRLAVECDSIAYHSGLRELQGDVVRQNRLVLAGWTVLRFTWDDLRNRPEYVVAQIRAALR